MKKQFKFISILLIVFTFLVVSLQGISALYGEQRTLSYHDLIIDDSEAGKINAQLDKEVNAYEKTKNNNGDIPSNKDTNIPTKYSSVTEGKIGSVKNQGSYGTCWAFSATSACEGSLFKNTGTMYDLSDLQLAYFFYTQKVDPLGNCSNDKTTNIEDTILDQGGNNVFTMWSLASWTNGALETSLPYTSTWQSKALNRNIDTKYANDYDIAHLQNAYIIPYSNSDSSRNNIKQAIMDYGQVCVSYYHDLSYLNSTYGAYYCTLSSSNHAVSIVGWNDDYPSSYFNSKPSGNGAWLVKNSWGSNWGTDGDAEYSNSGKEGFVWISYYDKSLIYTGKAFVYDFDTNSNYKYNYQYDGSCGTSTKYIYSYQKVGAIYTIKGLTSDEELLKAVGIGVSTTNTSGTVYIRTNVTDGKPESGTLVSQQSFSTSYTGYYTIKLDNPVIMEKGTTYSIVFDFNSGAYVFVDTSYQNGDWITFTADTTNDKTYVISSNSVTSLANSSSTARIKGYTVDTQHVDGDNDWSTPSYTWSDDYSKVTATRTCTRGKHAQTETVNTNAQTLSNPTCVSKGQIKYTSNSFSNTAFTVQTKTVDIPIDTSKHKIVKHDAKAATCTEIGWDAYETCDLCSYTTYVENKKLDHVYNITDNGVWNWTNFDSAKLKCKCDNCTNVLSIDASITDTFTTTPTCISNGEKKYTATATYNKIDYSDYKTEVVLASEKYHKYEFVDITWTDYTAKANYVCSHDSKHTKSYDCSVTEKETTTATCTVTGVKTYTATYDKYSATKTQDLGLAVNNHTFGAWNNEVKATCTIDGTKGYYYCSACKKNYDTNKVEITDLTIPALQHDYQYDSFVWDGYTAKAKYICSHDSSHVQTYDATVTNAVTTDPTCISKGVRTYTATYDKYSDTATEDVDMIDHTLGAWNNKIDATCTIDGTKGYYYCSACKKNYDTNKVEITDLTIPALQHDYQYDSFVWDGYTAKAKYICSHDNSHVQTYDAKVTDEVTTDPTCTDMGIRTYTATYDKYSDTKTQNIDALQHDYQYDSFVWDGYTAKAKYICSHDSKHVQTYDATVTNAVTTDPTCISKGVRTYTATYDSHSDTATEDVEMIAHTLGAWNNKIDATCTVDGTKGYYYCSACKKNYDTNKVEITDLTIPALQHDYQYDSFVWDGYTAKAKYVCSHDSSHVQTYDASMTDEITTTGTCTINGIKTYTATYKGHNDTKTEDLGLNVSNHTFGSWNNKIDATCTVDGTKGYYYCSACKKNYDANKVEITDLTIPALQHDYQYDSFVWDGYTAKAKYICSHDSKHVQTYDATVTNVVTTDPTCISKGVRTYTATYDKYSDTATEDVEMIAHTLGSWNNEVKATCTVDGTKGYYYCSACKKNYDINEAEITDLTIPALQHDYQYDSFVWDGYTAKAKYVCSHDSKHIETYDATMTDEITTAGTCTINGIKTYTATYKGHNDTKTEDLGLNVSNHTFGSWNNKIDATCTVDGTKGYYYCSACKKNYDTNKVEITDLTIPALQHDYQFVDITWTDYTAKANYVCSHDTKHTQSYDCSVTNAETTKPTCTDTGVRTYTATYDKYSDTKTQEISALQHDYQFDSFVWDNFKAKAKYVCSHDSKHVQTYDASVTNAVTTNPTCISKGVRTYTAVYEGHNGNTTEIIDEVDHNYGLWNKEEASTCSKEGIKGHYECLDCHKYFDFNHLELNTIVINKAEHDYSFVEFEWVDYDAYALLVCKNNSEHTDKVKANMKSSITKEPTCSSKGNQTFIASYDGNFAIKTKELSVLDHNYVFSKFEWDGYNAQAICICSYNSNHVKKFDSEVNNKITVEPGCLHEGVRTYTATYGLNTENKNEVLSKDTNIHNVSHVDKVNPTKQQDGNIEYWYCVECGKYFSDNDLKNTINQEATVLKAVEVSNISVNKSTFKTLYYVDEEIDLTNSLLNIKYSDNSEKNVEINKNMINSFDTKNPGEKDITISYENKTTTVKINVVVRGDLNNDNIVTDSDAIHLLMHTFFPEDYKVIQYVDFNKDGNITDADAIHLLMYTFFPEEYPIK